MTNLLTAIIWIIGIILAKGFWSTLFAVIIPPWALYLVIERVLHPGGGDLGGERFGFVLAGDVGFVHGFAAATVPG